MEWSCYDILALFQPFFLGEKFRQKGKKEKESDFRGIC
jgi:hypothetical protein